MFYNQNIKLPLVQRLYDQTNKQILNILHKAWVHYDIFWFTTSSQKSVQQLELFQTTQRRYSFTGLYVRLIEVWGLKARGFGVWIQGFTAFCNFFVKQSKPTGKIDTKQDLTWKSAQSSENLQTGFLTAISE